MRDQTITGILTRRGCYLWILAYTAQIALFLLIYQATGQLKAFSVIDGAVFIFLAQFGCVTLDQGWSFFTMLIVGGQTAAASFMHLGLAVIVLLKLLHPQPRLIVSTRVSIDIETQSLSFTVRNAGSSMLVQIEVLVFLRKGDASNLHAVPVALQRGRVSLLAANEMATFASVPAGRDPSIQQRPVWSVEQYRPGSDPMLVRQIDLEASDGLLIVATAIRLPDGQPISLVRAIRPEQLVVHRPSDQRQTPAASGLAQLAVTRVDLEAG